MDKLSALSAFIHVAQAGSFTAAAAELSTGPSAVTKKVAALERWLGVRLLHRSTHGVAVTDEGAVCLELGQRVLQGVDGLEQALASRRESASGQLRVAMPHAMGHIYLNPSLPQFLARNPSLSLQLHYSDDPPDLLEQRLDVAIHIGQPRDSRVVARILAHSWRVTCASPAYLEAWGEPRSIPDVQAHNGITLLRKGRRRTWRFASPAGEVAFMPAGSLSVNSGHALREAVLAGVGLAQCNSILVASDLRAGRLKVVLPETAVPSESLFAVYPHNRQMVPRVRSFLNLLDEVFRPYREPRENMA